jgi:hypothetical protein
MYRDEFAAMLRKALEEMPELATNMVLVLADDVREGEHDGEFRLCCAPMMRVESFVQRYGRE